MLSLNYDFLTWEVLRGFVLNGLVFSLQLTFVAMLGGIFLGTVLALCRLSGKKWLELPASVYIDAMRSVPLVMVIMGVFFLLPEGFYLLFGRWAAEHRPEMSALITFTLFEAAYYSEIMRAGIQSIPKGQVNAGYSLGLTYGQTIKLIVLPQAFRNMLPVLLTQTIILFQDTSLVYAIGAYDLLKGFEAVGRSFNRPVEMYLIAAAVYFVICFSLSMLVRKLQKRIQIIR